ncbi:MAG: type II toxin-antitoxin system Phd/YefM family antitoxin [Candidatus Delongbacteria bacterium]
MKIHTQIIEKEGKKEFVVIPINEFKKIEEMIEDYEDLRDLREAKVSSKGEKAVPLNMVMKSLKL